MTTQIKCDDSGTPAARRADGEIAPPAALNPWSGLKGHPMNEDGWLFKMVNRK